MKFTLTCAEAITIIRDAMGLDDFIDIEITEMPDKIEAEEPERLIQPFVVYIDILLAQSRTIAAIKLYRQVTSLGLKESKDVIDNWKRVRQSILLRNGLIKPSYGGDSKYTIDHWDHIDTDFAVVAAAIAS